MSRAAYSAATAADATGYSVDTIRRAIRAGELSTVTPKVTKEGARTSKPVILHAELVRWLST